MEKKYESLTLFEFQQRFPDDEACMEYLSQLKWGKGYVCSRCGNTKYCKGNKKYERQCTRCRYIESPTSGTLFHKIKFSILKAFYIVYYVSTTKKGISTTELSRKLGLRQKTCWLFKRKVMVAMRSSGKYLMRGEVEVDETVIGGEEEGVIGRKNEKKKVVVFGIEKRNKGVSRVYGKVIEASNSKELGSFMREKIDREANIKVDKWNGYKPLNAEFKKLKQVDSGKKGKNFPEMHRVIMGFKGWLRGIHHHVEHLQAYIDEYTYRFNRHLMNKNIFDNLLIRMVKAKPCPYKMIIT
jgi:transposase-like protein